MIKAVIFDMDGVLFDTERIMKEGWLYIAKEMNFTITEDQLSKMRGASKSHNAALFQEWYQGTISYEQARTMRSQYLADYIEKYSIPEKKGLHELFTYLKEQQIPCAVATSTDRILAEHYWELAGITGYLQASVCGDEVTHSKPDPEIFLTAAKKLQVPIQNCMIVEDSINGLTAARASGGISCMVPDLTPYTPELKPICDYVCNDLNACISVLDTVNSAS